MFLHIFPLNDTHNIFKKRSSLRNHNETLEHPCMHYIQKTRYAILLYIITRDYYCVSRRDDCRHRHWYEIGFYTHPTRPTRSFQRTVNAAGWKTTSINRNRMRVYFIYYIITWTCNIILSLSVAILKRKNGRVLY